MRRVWTAGANCALRFGIAVSGGPDSLALLLLCHGLKPGLIEAATIDHRLRAENAAEAQAVAELCAELGIPHRTLAVTLAGGNVQAGARAVRYAALGNWARERGLMAIATAHHANDQAETMLMRLNRASGLRGLAGIRATRADPNTGTLVVRPLLSWRKAELEELVAAAGIHPARDPSNHDPRFDRARMRRALASADWLDPLALARSARHLAEAESAVSWFVGEVWDREVQQSGDRIAWAQSEQPSLVTLGIIERGIAFAGGSTFDFGDVARLHETLHRTGGKANLAGIMVEFKRGVWTFEPEPPRSSG